MAALTTQAPQGALSLPLVALAPAASNPLVLRPHPFSQDHGVAYARSGQTIQQMLDGVMDGVELAPTVRVEVGGYDVPRALWGNVRPKSGVALHVTRMPAGGSGKKWLRTILLIVVMVVAWYAAPMLATAYGGTAAMWAAGIYMVGSLIVNALVPPPQPKLGGGGNMGDAGQLNMLTGSSNQLSPYGPIPLVIGESRIYPPHAAMPYSETLGQVSYQRLMFDLGYGDIDVSDIRIGDSPLSAFEGVQFEITKTPTLYTSDVNEQVVSAQMNDGDSVVRTTAPNVDEISVDIVFPQGLFGVDNKGNLAKGVAASITIDYRAIGTTEWKRVPGPGQVTGGTFPRLVNVQWLWAKLSFTTQSPDRKPFGASFAWGVDSGQYEVRVRRGATNWSTSESLNRVGDATWSIMRSIRRTNPSKTGTTKLCMRIKASEQLNGTLQTLSCLVRQRIPVYDPATKVWSAPQVSLNPAWVYHWLLTSCPAFAVHVPSERIDLQSIVDYAAFCKKHDFEVRGTLDTKVTARQIIDDVLACALGAVTLRDGKYGVLFDHGDTVPVMVFTPLDTKSFSASRVFTRLPHALRVRFRNPAANWQMDEVTVVDDGYAHRGRDARGNPLSSLQRNTDIDVRVTSDGKIRALADEPSEPSEFETLDLRMAADAHQAWRVARHHFAQAKFRPNMYTWETDIANLACTRGDLVHVAHDVTEWGDAWGQITAIDGATVTLAEQFTLDPTRTYTARIRRRDGSSQLLALASVPDGASYSFSLVEPPDGANITDVVVLGETHRETRKLLITGIQPSADLGARVTAVEYDARVEPYWTNPPIEIFSEVSGAAYRDPPPAPNITVIVSNPINDTPNDGGVSTPEVHIGIRPPSGYVPPRINDYPPTRQF